MPSRFISAPASSASMARYSSNSSLHSIITVRSLGTQSGGDR